MRKESSNQFTEGLVSDLNPINTPNTVLTDALNATIITYNGNEFSLQNDMGNYPLENCKLKPNYIPVGLKEHGDILYIVSYNPLTNHVEVGSYPSPVQVNAVDSEDYELEFGSILENHLGITANYSDLVKEETYIVFNGEDYKLYPGDAYKIDAEEEKYAYETFEYYILDDNSVLHDVTAEVKKNINKEEYEHVSWLIPGYIAAKARLARLSASGLNVRSFYAPINDTNTRDVYFDFNLRVNVEDDLINNRLNNMFEYKNDLTFKVTIDSNKKGNLKTEVLENPNLSEWYLDKNIIWNQYKGNLTTDKDDVLTVSVTPILSEKKNNTNLYSIAYDGLIQPQEFDLSRVNDKPFGIDNDFYKFYQTNDKEQIIEINVSGPTITTSQVDLYYNIYTLEEQNKPAKTGKFDNYFGIGYNRLTIPFDDVFKKENIYTIEFVFKGDVEFTSSRRLLITTELLNGSDQFSAYDRDLTMDYLIEKYFERVKKITKPEIQKVNENYKEDYSVVSDSEIIDKYCDVTDNYNAFIKEGLAIPENFVANIQCEIEANVEFTPTISRLRGDLWENIMDYKIFYKVNDTLQLLSDNDSTVNSLIKGVYLTPINGHMRHIGEPFNFYKIKNASSLWQQKLTKGKFESNYDNGKTYNFSWDNDFPIINVGNDKGFVMGCHYPFKHWLSYPPVCYELYHKHEGENYLIFPGVNYPYAITDKRNIKSILLSYLYTVYDKEGELTLHSAYSTVFDNMSSINKYQIETVLSFKNEWIYKNLTLNDYLNINALFKNCLKYDNVLPTISTIYDYIYEVDIKSKAENLLTTLREKRSESFVASRISNWKQNPVYINKHLKSEIYGLYCTANNEKLNDFVKTLDQAYVNGEYWVDLPESMITKNVTCSFDGDEQLVLYEIGDVSDYIDDDNSDMIE